MSMVSMENPGNLVKDMTISPQVLAVKNAIDQAINGVNVASALAAEYAQQYKAVEMRETDSSGHISDVTAGTRLTYPRYVLADYVRRLSQTQNNIDQYVSTAKAISVPVRTDNNLRLVSFQPVHCFTTATSQPITPFDIQMLGERVHFAYHNEQADGTRYGSFEVTHGSADVQSNLGIRLPKWATTGDLGICNTNIWLLDGDNRRVAYCYVTKVLEVHSLTASTLEVDKYYLCSIVHRKNDTSYWPNSRVYTLLMSPSKTLPNVFDYRVVGVYTSVDGSKGASIYMSTEPYEFSIYYERALNGLSFTTPQLGSPGVWSSWKTLLTALSQIYDDFEGFSVDGITSAETGTPTGPSIDSSQLINYVENDGYTITADFSGFMTAALPNFEELANSIEELM